MFGDLPLSETALGLSLRRWRALNRVKQAALADELGVSQTTVSRWEKGQLAPGRANRRRILALLAARPASQADRVLRDLVESAATPMHLVCDLTHTLHAASPSRAADWHVPQEDFLGASLWRFATDGIVAAERVLASQGWYDLVPPDLTFVTERREFAEMTIRAGRVRITRIALSDGRYARLVRDAGNAAA